MVVPAGKFVLTQDLQITSSKVVLRGAGVSCRHLLHGIEPPPAMACLLMCLLLTACLQASATTLYFPKTLSSVYGNAKTWAFSGGFLRWGEVPTVSWAGH